MRILIVKPTALGDVAQALRAAPILKSAFPQSHISWIVDSAYRELVACSPAVDEIIEFPRKRWKSFRCFFEVSGWIRNLRKEKYDIVLDLQGLARSGLMTAFSRGKRKVGLTSAREFSSYCYRETVNDSAQHAVDRYLQAVNFLVTGRADGNTDVFLKHPGGGLPERLSPGEFTILHPYTNWKTKLWNFQRFARLAAQLPEEQFVMVGQGPYFPLEEVPNILDLRNKTSLNELISLSGQARMMISTDSGPLHIAAAFGVPTISLFGATDPDKTRQRGRLDTVLRSGVACSPCLKRTCHHSTPMECMQKVSVDRVKAAWEDIAKEVKKEHDSL